MENDQIKSQIENAKRAFVASKERDREASSDELDMDDAQLQENITNGKKDPFDGKYTIGELLGMNKYVKGIDASLPK